VRAKGRELGEIRDPTLSALRTEGREGGGEGDLEERRVRGEEGRRGGEGWRVEGEQGGG
jgi:hypothetical protein